MRNAVLAVLALLVAGLGFGHVWVARHHAAQLQAVQAQVDVARSALKAAGQVRGVESWLSEKTGTIEKEVARENQNIDSRFRIDFDGVRHRPEARSDGGDVPQAGASEAGTGAAGCTGQGLARPDAQFLAGYAADAARLRLALAECAARYEAARQAIERVNGGTTWP